MFLKTGVLNISQNSLENICEGVGNYEIKLPVILTSLKGNYGNFIKCL